MADSRKLSTDPVAHLRHFLSQHVRASDRLCVGFSGGGDSLALLDMLWRMRESFDAPISAVHINHGLSPNAAAWERFCVQQCEMRSIPLRVERVQVDLQRGGGLEEAARAARYAAFARQDVDAILLAHHQDDQVETLLLRLLRGAGVRGLGAMREHQMLASIVNTNNSIRLLRPLLLISREILLGYLRNHDLQWIDDESNQNRDQDRNYLRHEILPSLQQRFPHYAGSIARAAQHLQEASDFIDVIVAADLAACLQDGALQLSAVRRLPVVRARHLLRRYVRQHLGGELSLAQTRALEAQALHARDDAQVAFVVAGKVVSVYRDALSVRSQIETVEAQPWRVDWRGETALSLPAPHGGVTFAPRIGDGISVYKLEGRAITLRPRVGGERMRLSANRPTRTLKNLLQEAAIPPWQRRRLPLLFCDDTLVWVAGIGIDVSFQTGATEPGIVPNWHASEAGL